MSICYVLGNKWGSSTRYWAAYDKQQMWQVGLAGCGPSSFPVAGEYSTRLSSNRSVNHKPLKNMKENKVEAEVFQSFVNCYPMWLKIALNGPSNCALHSEGHQYKAEMLTLHLVGIDSFIIPDCDWHPGEPATSLRAFMLSLIQKLFVEHQSNSSFCHRL